jgi:hypothetical protein
VITAQVKFSGNFESGNISSVTTTDSVTYYVTTIEDIGGRWFYFKMTGVLDRYVRVNIQNSDVRRPFYSYDNRNFVRFTSVESPQTNWFQKTYDEDTVYVAYYIPYNYSYLQERLQQWTESEYVKFDTLGISPNNFPMQEMILTDFTVPDDNKYRVWIHARTHPGETPSSWQFDGIMQKLLEDDEVIDYYRKNIVFYLYPFNNPEGVYFGRSRTNFFGVDHEREWDKTPEETAPEINILKNRMIEINNEKVLDVFLNLHSQAAPYCTFWIHTPESTSDYFYRREYQFSNLNTSDNPHFVQDDYRESNLRRYFPEGYLWATHGDEVMALTYETPYDQYSSDEWVTNESLFEIGYRTVYAVAEYLELSHSKHSILDNKNALANGNWNSAEDGLEFYSDDYLFAAAGDESSSISFSSEELETGIYDVYGWWPSDAQNSFSTSFDISGGNGSHIIEKTQRTNGGQWNFLSQVELTDESAISVTMNGNSTGRVVADAFRVIYRSPVSSVDEGSLPEQYTLHQNYPNPFNPSTTIRFELSKPEKVVLRIFNPLGELLDVIVDRDLGAGSHEVIFNSNNYSSLSSGIYYYQIIAGDFSRTKGMILVK